MLPKGYALVGEVVRLRGHDSLFVVTGWHGGNIYMLVQKWYLDRYPDTRAGATTEWENLEKP